MQKKAAIELSINFIVIIVMSVVIFAGGIFIAQKMFSGADDVLNDLDQQSVARIESLLDDGARVAIPFKTRQASRGESAVFGIGILNILKTPTDFTIEVEFDSAYDGDTLLCDSSSNPTGCTPAATSWNTPDDWPIYDTQPHTLKTNQKDVYRILVKVPDDATSGTYIFNVKVTYEDSPGNPISYDPLRKLLVNVP
ncbi:MAG: hypothetical protein GXP63_04515 [DPANN group archaeon]|nr:hypothetical protein [DPANN group archaeon]